MNFMSTKEQIEMIIIDAILKHDNCLESRPYITSETKLDDIGFDEVDTVTLYPDIIEMLVYSEIVDDNFRFKDAPRRKNLIAELEVYWTVGDLVEQVLKEVNKTSGEEPDDFHTVMADPIGHGLIVTDLDHALSSLAVILEEVENLTQEQREEFYPIVRDLEVAMRPQVSPPSPEPTED